MKRSTIRHGLPALALCLFASVLLAQEPEKKPFEPYVGLPGKDVIWLPADLTMVNKMMDIATVTADDVVMDLGSGDGRTVIGAAKRGARGIGVEFNPDMVALSRRNAEHEGVTDRVSFEQGDLFEADLTRVTVITLFLLPSINEKLRPKLLDLRPGTRIVSNTFTMGEWKPDNTVRDETQGGSCGFNCVAYLWRIPSKVAGTWQVGASEMKLEQQFQRLTGTMQTGARSVPVAGRLLGDRISLSGQGVEYEGLVVGNTMTGSVRTDGKAAPWRAVKN